MPRQRVVNRELLLRKRQLRAEIAQTRDSTRATLAGLKHEQRRLTSWQTYVRRFPVAALGIAFGAGLWISAGGRGRGIPRSIANSLVQWGMATAKGVILQDLLDIWTRSRASSYDENAGDSPRR